MFCNCCIRPNYPPPFTPLPWLSGRRREVHDTAREYPWTGVYWVSRGWRGCAPCGPPPPTLLSTHNWALQTAESSVEYTPLQRIQAHGTRLGFKNEVWRSSAQISAYKSGIKNSVFRCNSGSVKRNFGSKILRILIF